MSDNTLVICEQALQSILPYFPTPSCYLVSNQKHLVLQLSNNGHTNCPLLSEKQLVFIFDTQSPSVSQLILVPDPDPAFRRQPLRPVPSKFDVCLCHGPVADEQPETKDGPSQDIQNGIDQDLGIDAGLASEGRNAPDTTKVSIISQPSTFPKGTLTSDTPPTAQAHTAPATPTTSTLSPPYAQPSSSHATPHATR